MYLLMTGTKAACVPLTHLSPCRVLTGPPEGLEEGSSELSAPVKCAAGTVHWPSSPERHPGCHESHSESLPQRSGAGFGLRLHNDALPLHAVLQVREAVLPGLKVSLQGQGSLGCLTLSPFLPQPCSLPTVHAVSPVSPRLDWKNSVS